MGCHWKTALESPITPIANAVSLTLPPISMKETQLLLICLVVCLVRNIDTVISLRGKGGQKREEKQH